jgi:hypothetical protein
MDVMALVAIIVVGWIILSIIVALLWHLLMSPLPHPDEFVDAQSLQPRASTGTPESRQHRSAA